MTKQPRGKKPSKLLSSEIHLIDAIVVAIVGPLAMLCVWFFTKLSLFGVQPTLIEQIVGIVALILVPVFPVAAFRTYLNKQRHYDEALSRMPSSQKEEIIAKSKNLNSLYLTVAGIVAVVMIIFNAWPRLVDSYANYQSTQRYEAAIERGCKKYGILERADGDLLYRQHKYIIDQWGDESYEAVVFSSARELGASFERCLDESITPSEQADMLSKHQQLVETKAHELLRKNPYNLPKDQIEKIRQNENKSHQ